jgi:hypothetical protein
MLNYYLYATAFSQFLCNPVQQQVTQFCENPEELNEDFWAVKVRDAEEQKYRLLYSLFPYPLTLNPG